MLDLKLCIIIHYYLTQTHVWVGQVGMTFKDTITATLTLGQLVAAVIKLNFLFVCFCKCHSKVSAFLSAQQ